MKRQLARARCSFAQSDYTGIMTIRQNQKKSCQIMAAFLSVQSNELELFSEAGTSFFGFLCSLWKLITLQPGCQTQG